MIQEEVIMSITQTTTLEQWLLLGVFFLIFAVYGFFKNTNSQSCRPCHYITIGLLFIVANSMILFVANRTGLESFNVVQMVTLKQTTIESSFIVFGYCLIIQDLAMFIKALFSPPLSKQVVVIYNSFSAQPAGYTGGHI